MPAPRSPITAPSLHAQQVQLEWEIQPSWLEILLALAARGLRIYLGPDGRLHATPPDRASSMETREFLAQHRALFHRLASLEAEAQHQMLVTEIQVNLRLQAARLQRLDRASPLYAQGMEALARSTAWYERLVLAEHHPDLFTKGEPHA